MSLAYFWHHFVSNYVNLFSFVFFCFVAGSLFYRWQLISSMKIYICFIQWENGILNIYERGRERDFHLIHFVFFKKLLRIHNLLICHRTGLSITLLIFYTLIEQSGNHCPAGPDMHCSWFCLRIRSSWPSLGASFTIDNSYITFITFINDLNKHIQYCITYNCDGHQEIGIEWPHCINVQ